MRTEFHPDHSGATNPGVDIARYPAVALDPAVTTLHPDRREASPFVAHVPIDGHIGEQTFTREISSIRPTVAIVGNTYRRISTARLCVLEAIHTAIHADDTLVTVLHESGIAGTLFLEHFVTLFTAV